MECLNHYSNWLKTITNEIDKFIINCEYNNFFMQMHIHWSKDNSYTSLYQTFIIPRLPRFEKMDLSQFQLYIETETMIKCFLCCSCHKTVLNRSSEVKVKSFCILKKLRIHTGLRKLSKTNLFDLYLLKSNQFDISKPCIKIAKSELLFEPYRMALD